ncbi:MAG: hypothetical protein M1825_002043 [Sarcosagium campestre]|nr:MAG: hypothetical protein M1825_002043 [Sarcosagium campestre]
MGFRIVCPDLMGFGGTDAPRVPPESIELYGHKRAADDIKELASQLGASKITLGGHDWGGAVVYRTALWHPDLVTHIFVACTPYSPTSRVYRPIELVVKTKAPNFAYQLQLAGPDVEQFVKSKDQIRQFLNAMYGGRTSTGETAFVVEQGVLLDKLQGIGKSPLLNDEEMDYYVEEYTRNGLHGTLNWYRNRKQCYEEELALQRSEIHVPVLFIQATKDAALPPWMAANMSKNIPHLTKTEVEADHWVLWQAPGKVNVILEEWIKREILDAKGKL